VLIAPLLRYLATVVFPNHWQIYSLTLFRMDLLAAGALVALGWRHHRELLERVGIYGLFLVGLMAAPLIVLSQFSWFRLNANTISANVWLYEMILIGYIGVLLCALGGRGVHFLRWRPLMYFGRISYTFYLVHTAALLIVRRHLHHYSVGNVTAFAAAVLYSAISWRFFEQPILRVPARRPSRSWRMVEKQEEAMH
jgi:peptidoglycan/LPS O-acetylase OafA/YrhL